MKFIYDITRLYVRRNETTPTGIDRVDINYVLHLLKSQTEVIFARGEKGNLNTFPADQAKLLIRKLATLWVGSDWPKNSVCNVNYKKPISHVIGSNDTYIYINVSHQVVTARFSLLELSEKENVRLIFFCHDLIPIDYPEYVGEQGREKHSALVNLMLWTGDLIILNSEYSKNCLIDYAKRNNFCIPKLVVNHLGNEQSLKSRLWNKEKKHSHFLYLSTFEPRKNHILLFLVWKKLYSILGNQTPKLLLVGKKGWQIDWLERYFSVEPNVSRFVERKENISDSELKNLMLNSYASLNPSYVEGWGLPAVESVSMGIPTACSDIPAYREATQGLATYLSPLNAEEWIMYVLSTLDNKIKSPDPRSFIYETWDDHFAILEKSLEEIVKIKRQKNANNLYIENISSFNFVKTSTNKKEEKNQTTKEYKPLKVHLLKSKIKTIRIIGRILYNRTL